MSAPTTPRTDRLEELDALRGIAAIGVVAYHAVALHPPSREIMWGLFCSPLFPLVTGRPFVLLFFVLSGFVLHAALVAERRARGAVDVAAFLAKRFCRIWPPFAAAGLLAAALGALTLLLPAPDSVPPPMRGWPVEVTGGFGLEAVLRHLALDGIEIHLALNSVSWSLVYELRIALLLPLLSLFVARAPLATLIATAVVGALAGVALAGSNPTTLAEQNYQAFDDLGLSLLATIYYLPMFVLGAAAAELRASAGARLETFGPRGGVAVFALCWAMLWFPNDVVVAIGAALLVLLVAANRSAGWVLSGQTATFFGRISYSLYLVHLPWLYAAIAALGGALGQLPALLVGVATLPALAAAFHALAERPAQAAGRMAAKAIAARRVAAPPQASS